MKFLPKLENTDLRTKLFLVLAVIGCISNAGGFIANIFMFGFTSETTVCGASLLIVILAFIYGVMTGHTYRATIMILIVLSMIEFPILYLAYGETTIVYMLVAEVAVAIYIKSKHRFIFASIIFIVDIAALIIRHLFPELNKANGDTFIMTLVALVIAFFSILFTIALVVMNYEKQTAELSRMSEELLHSVNTDPLTDIRNRRYLMQYLSAQLAGMTEEKHYAVLVDLDFFKSVNDTYGHVFGDKVLKMFATVAKESIGENDLIARFGGEEFMILFATDSIPEIKAKMSMISSRYAEFSQAEKGIELTFSAGAAVYDRDSSIKEIFTTADKRLYKAKECGRNMMVME